MLDFVPPAAMALLNALVGVHLLGRRGPALPHGPSVAICVLAPIIYGIGAATFLVFSEAAKRGLSPAYQTIGTAFGALGTFCIPLALAFTVLRARRERALLGALALVTWLIVWISPLLSVPWGARERELMLALYVAVAAWASLVGLRALGDGAGLERRMHVAALPLFALGFAYLLLKGPDMKQPVFSTSVLVGGELMLLVVLADRLGPDDGPNATPRTFAYQVILLALTALLLLLVAINLGLFPRDNTLAVTVALVVATGLSLAYGAFRASFDGWLRATLYPEEHLAAERIESLQRELEATRERLRETEHLSLVGQLAAEVAHEIKNPLGPIKGYARIIERDLAARGALSDVVARGIAVIREEVEAIDARARRLLEASRPPQPVPEPLDLGRAVDDVLDLLRADAPAVRIAWSAPPPPAPAELDRLLLRSALGNVVKNAADALGARGGSITLGLSSPSGDPACYALTVEDDGPGLPADLEPEALFRPFVSRREGGTGLGLVIARGAMRALGGDLTLGRRDPGPGARAVLRVPVRAQVAPPPPTPSSSASGTRPALEPAPTAGGVA